MKLFGLLFKDNKKGILLALFIATFCFRLYLVFQQPIDSTDQLRNLAFTSHLPEVGTKFYNYTLLDLSTTGPRFHWSWLNFTYPPFAMIFFAVFSSFGLGTFWVKLTLTLMDTLSAVIFWNFICPYAGLLFYLNPTAMFYISREGQFEALQTLMIVLNVLAVLKGRWFLAGLCFAISIQTKLFGVILLPWIFYFLVKAPERRPALIHLGLGTVLGIVPFIQFYFHSPKLLLYGALNRADNELFNPFYWNFLSLDHFDWLPAGLRLWTSSISLGLVSVAFFYACYRSFAFKESPIAFIPFLAAWGVIKYSSWGMFWYSLLPLGFLMCLYERRRLVALILLLHCIIELRVVTLVLGYPTFGHTERVDFQRLQRVCLFKCDLK